MELTTGIDGFENDMIQSKSSEQFQNGEQTTSASMMNDETDYDSHRYNYQPLKLQCSLLQNIALFTVPVH